MRKFLAGEIDNILSNLFEKSITEDAIGIGIISEQQSVVVSHLFEMRDGPCFIHGVPMKAAAQLVVETAACHSDERFLERVFKDLVFFKKVSIEKKLDSPRHGEFRRAPEPPVELVKIFQHFFCGLVHICLILLSLPGCPLFQEIMKFSAVLIDCFFLDFIKLAHGTEYRLEAGPSEAVGQWKVGTPVKRFFFRRQEYAQGPAALETHGGNSLLIAPVYIGTFVPVELDSDEVLVEKPGYFIILKTFLCHDMAPMAPKGAGTQKYRLVFLLCLFKGLF